MIPLISLKAFFFIAIFFILLVNSGRIFLYLKFRAKKRSTNHHASKTTLKIMV